MDLFDCISFIVLIFVFYFFVIYQFFRIIYQKLVPMNIKSRIKNQKLGKKHMGLSKNRIRLGKKDFNSKIII